MALRRLWRWGGRRRARPRATQTRAAGHVGEGLQRGASQSPHRHCISDLHCLRGQRRLHPLVLSQLFAESISLLRDSSQSVAVRGGCVLGQGQGVLQAVVFLPQSFDFLLQGTEGTAVVISGPSAAAGVSTASRTLANIQIRDALSCLRIGCS